MSMIWPMVGCWMVSRLCAISCFVQFNSERHQSGIFSCGCEILTEVVISQVSPSVHIRWPNNFSGVIALEGMSAGLSSLEQWLQFSAETSGHTSFTRFCTNGFQSFPVPLIQKSETCESVKHLSSSNSIRVDRLSATVTIRRAKRTVHKSSSLGMVSVFNGATQVFDVTKLEHLRPLTSVTKYTTAA